jgi:hypothetical protein
MVERLTDRDGQVKREGGFARLNRRVDAGSGTLYDFRQIQEDKGHT